MIITTFLLVASTLAASPAPVPTAVPVVTTFTQEPRPVAIGAIVDGIFEGPDEIDEYTFAGKAGQKVIVYLQGMNGVDWTWYDLALVDPSGAVLGTAESKGNAPKWQADATKTVTLPADGSYTVRVQPRAKEQSSTGPYRFQVRLAN